VAAQALNTKKSGGRPKFGKNICAGINVHFDPHTYWFDFCLRLGCVFVGKTRQFRAVLQALEYLHVPQFALVPATYFLCMLKSSPEISNTGIRLSTSDGNIDPEAECELFVEVSVYKRIEWTVGDIADGGGLKIGFRRR
jgi:hypothetical protein